MYCDQPDVMLTTLAWLGRRHAALWHRGLHPHCCFSGPVLGIFENGPLSAGSNLVKGWKKWIYIGAIDWDTPKWMVFVWEIPTKI